MQRRYWLALFTGKAWDDFLTRGADVRGFRASRINTASKISPGDYFLCYVTGISRFIGVLEVKSKLYIDKKPIWGDYDFPLRFKCELIYRLTPKTSVPVHKIKDKLSIFMNLKSPKSWTGYFRGSPTEFNAVDGEAVVGIILEAVHNPVEEGYDEKKYYKK